MELRVQVPHNYPSERKYTISVLLGDFLGLSYSVSKSSINNTIISADSTKILSVCDIFFSQPEENWLHPSSIPEKPLKSIDTRQTALNPNVTNPIVPVIFGEFYQNKDFINIYEKSIRLGIDIFGSAFFMLSRYEEVIKTKRDHHNRFPASESLAFQENFLLRPIINEYVEILWSCLVKLWPGLKRKNRNFRIFPSHDVDCPFSHAGRSKIGIAKSLARDILKRHSFSEGIDNLVRRLTFKNDQIQDDPYNTFNWIMDISERFNLTSIFNFIPEPGWGGINGDYSLHHSLIRNLLRQIHARGHEIGAHFSYNSYSDITQAHHELGILKKVCKEEGIEQISWGARQHFLRCENPITFRSWEQAGIDYDSTLTYAEHAGFRSGTCYEYPLFDLGTNRILNIRERPLIAMECSVIDNHYMGLGTGEQAFDFLNKLKQTCKLFSGDFTLLWHNNRLVSPEYCELYKSIVKI